LFDFRAFLNVAMLLVESKNAKVLRQIILDIFNAISIVDEFY
jgi:ciab protein